MYGVSEKKRKRGRTLSKISKLSAESDLVEEEEGEGDESDAVNFPLTYLFLLTY